MVRRVRDILGEDIRWQTVASAGTGADTTIDVTDGTDWSEGTILEWQEDGDQAYVQSVSSNVLTVIRSVNGTTGATHGGTAATKDPIYPYIKVTDAIDACIQTLWPWAWKTVEAVITPSSSTVYFNLGNDVIDIVRAWQEDGSTIPVARFLGARGSGKPIALGQSANSLTGVSYDYVVAFPNGVYHATNTIYVQYRALITDAVSGGDYADISEGGLSEVLCWGAAARLIKTTAAARLRGDARQWNSTIDVEQISQTSDFFYAEYKRLLNDYYDNLMRTNPPMKKWSR